MTDAANALVPVAFHGDTIFAVEQPDSIYVVAKPIAERFGLNWASQFTRLKSDPVLSEGIVTIAIPSISGMQQTTCLRLDLLNGWLFKIDSRRVRPEAREALIAYQRECYAVLFQHFQPTAAAMDDGSAAPSGTPRIADELTAREKITFVRETRLLHGVAAGRRMWAMLDLPDVTGRPAAALLGGDADGRACLSYLLGLDVGGRTVRDWVADGQDGTALNRVGLRVRDDGLFIGNGTAIFAGSRWAGGTHRPVLLAVQGVHIGPNLTLHHRAMRGLLVPLAVLSEVA